MKKRTILIVAGLVLACVSLNKASEVEAAALDLPVNTISGAVFHDINENGLLDLVNLETALPNQSVSLYKNVEDAKSNQNALSKSATNRLGTFSFSKLKRGSYFIRYNFDTGYRPVGSVSDSQGNELKGITKVDVTTSKVLYTTNLPLKKLTALNIVPFEDKNWDGIKNPEENVMNGKTMVIINIRRFAEAIETGALDTIDVSKLVLNAVGGSVDIADAIHLRTTKNGEIINMPDVSSGLYVIIRSPFNLTLTEMLGNVSEINALLAILQGKDLSAILDNPELVGTGDIDTNSDNEYIKLLASLFPKIADEAEKLDYNSLLGEDTALTIGKTSGQLRSIGMLLDKVPAMRFAKVDYFGTAYDLTGLKFKKTNEYLFGIKNYGSISGTIFNDTNLNGKKDLTETTRAVEVTAYNENGNVIKSVTSPALVGEYKLSGLSYGQTIYLGVATDAALTNEIVEGKPVALADKRIVQVVNFERNSGISSVNQNIGIGNVNTIGLKLKSLNPANNSGVITFSNTNSAALTLNYSVNGSGYKAVSIKAKGLLSKESTLDVTLNNLAASGNVIDYYWSNGLYRGQLTTTGF